MGEINFLTNNTSSGNSGSNSKKKSVGQEDVKEMKWTKTRTDDSEKTSSVFGFKKNKTKEEIEDDKERIEKSRQEVLEMRDSEKNPKKDTDNSSKKEVGDDAKKSSAKSSSCVSKIFRGDTKIEKKREVVVGEIKVILKGKAPEKEIAEK